MKAKERMQLLERVGAELQRLYTLGGAASPFG